MCKEIKLTHQDKIRVAEMVAKGQFLDGQNVMIKDAIFGNRLKKSGFLGAYNRGIAFVSRRGRKYIRTELKNILTAMGL